MSEYHHLMLLVLLLFFYSTDAVQFERSQYCDRDHEDVCPKGEYCEVTRESCVLCGDICVKETVQSIIKLCEQKCPEEFQKLFATMDGSQTTDRTLTNSDLSAEKSNEDEPQTENNTSISTDTIIIPTTITLIVISGLLLCVTLAIIIVGLFIKMRKSKNPQRILPCPCRQVSYGVLIIIFNP